MSPWPTHVDIVGHDVTETAWNQLIENLKLAGGQITTTRDPFGAPKVQTCVKSIPRRPQIDLTYVLFIIIIIHLKRNKNEKRETPKYQKIDNKLAFHSFH